MSEIEKKDQDEILDPEKFEDEKNKEDEDEKEDLEDDNSKADDDSSDSDSDDDQEDEKVKAQKKAELEKQKKRNAEFAEKRRKQEEAERTKREAEIRAQAERDTKLGIYKKNTYTDEPIKDEEDLRIFEIMKGLEEEGKDPINDLPFRIAELSRKEKAENAKKLESEAKLKENIQKDINEFKQKYPKVNLAELANDEEYLKISAGKIGRWSTIEIYEYYLDKKEKSKSDEEKKKLDSKIDEEAKNKTNIPSPSGKNPKQKDVDDMNLEEYQQYMKRKYH